MTTLPQTTPLRLPRATTATQLGAPAVAPLGILPPAGAAPQMTGGDVMRILRTNLWLIILLTIISGAAGYAVNSYLLKYYPKYTASAWLTVSSDVQDNPLKPYANSTDLQGINLQVKTHQQLLHSASVFSATLRDPNSPIRATNWINQIPDPGDQKKDLVDNFAVTTVQDTPLIRVQMTCNSGADAEKIIKSIVDEYIREQQQQNTVSEETYSEGVKSKRDSLQIHYSDLTQDMNAKAPELNLGTESGSGILNIKYSEMASLTSRKMDNDLQLADANHRYEHLTSEIKMGNDPAEILDKVNNDPEVVRDRQYISSYDIELVQVKKQYGPQNQQVQDIQDQEALYTTKLSTALANAKASYRASAIEEATRARDSAQLADDDVSSRMTSLDNEIAGLSKTLADYETDKEDRDFTATRLKEFNDQLAQAQDLVNQKQLSTVRWNSPPEAEDRPSSPQLKVTMAAAIAMGVLLSLMIAFLREFMDTSVRSPRDISRVGNMTLLGMVPHEDDDPQSQGARLPLVIFEAPQSMMAEQLRQVRTRLQHSASLDTTRSILITSPGPDDGKSTIAANLASGLALNGRRILLVDANFRRPSLHRTFNLGNDQGFSDVLNSLDLFETSVQETTVPNLYVLPSGIKPTNATELLESQLLTDFIERALEEFDHVIFDSGPLLFVSETVALAPRVDGVVTVVRARSNSRGVLQRMRDSLRQLKAEHLGVVLNAVRSQGGGYYRSNIRTYYDYQNGRAA